MLRLIHHGGVRVPSGRPLPFSQRAFPLSFPNPAISFPMIRFGTKFSTWTGLLGAVPGFIAPIWKRHAALAERASSGGPFALTSGSGVCHQRISRGAELHFASYSDYLDWPLTVHEARPHPKPSVQPGRKALAMTNPAWRSSEDALLDRLNARSADAAPEGFREIVFVSADLGYDEYFLTYLDSCYELRFISPDDGDAFEQIGSVVGAFGEVGAVHLLGRCDRGSFFLGCSILDNESMGSHQCGWLEAVVRSLAPDGALFLYGGSYDPESESLALVARLAAVTGIEVTFIAELLPGQAALEASPVRLVPAVPLVGSPADCEILVTLSTREGGLALASDSGISFLGGTREGDSRLEIGGTLRDVEAAVGRIAFTPALHDFVSSEHEMKNESDRGAPAHGIERKSEWVNAMPVIVGPFGAEIHDASLERTHHQPGSGPGLHEVGRFSGIRAKTSEEMT